MINADFWKVIRTIVAEGFSTKGLQKLDYYAEQFISGRLVYQRFSPLEQHGCAEGGETHVIASLLAGAEIATNPDYQKSFLDFESERQCAAQQESCIEGWARRVGCWIEKVDDSLSQTLGKEIAEGGEAKVYDHGTSFVKSIGLDYFIQPILALDRITLHNAYFPETRLYVLGFGRDKDGNFRIVVEQPFIKGFHMADNDIAQYMEKMGFKLINARNWTYATPEVYLSDMHDENVLCSSNGTVFVIDCDIRINTPELRAGGTRLLTTDVSYV